MEACSEEHDNLSRLFKDPMFRKKFTLITKASAGEKKSFHWMFQKYKEQLSQKEWEKFIQFLNGEETEWMKTMLVETVHDTVVSNFSLVPPLMTDPTEGILRKLWLENPIFCKKVTAYQTASAIERAGLLFGLDEYLQLLPTNEAKMFENFLEGEPHPCWMSDTPICYLDSKQYKPSAGSAMKSWTASMPLIYCPSCKQNCENGTRCEVSGKYHF
jgi:hypothetical protein